MRGLKRFDTAELRASARAAWGAFWPSRLVVFGAAMWAIAADLPPNTPPESTYVAHPFYGWPAQGAWDLVFSSLAKWDTQHYLAIALDGYVEGVPALPPVEARPAFFPLYPGSVHVFSGFSADPAVVMLAAYAVSLACFFGALTLLHRLTAIEIGERFARPTLLLLAFFPTAFFYGIPYSESMFLLLAVGAFLAARTGHWAVAGIVLALASATRAPGILLIVPVALLYLYGPRADRGVPVARLRGRLWPRFRIAPNAAWLLLAPLGMVLFSLYLQYKVGDALAWDHAQLASFNRHTVDPFTGVWAGLREAGKAIHELAVSTEHGVTRDHLYIAEVGFVGFAIAGGIGALRRLPVAYGSWVLLSLVPTFLSQQPENPLWSSPRFIAVLFPVFMWLALVVERRRRTTTVVALFAAGMAVLTVQFALWSFVA